MELPRLIKLPVYGDASSGLLTVLDRAKLPFAIKRLFWMTDLKKNSHRGGHAHKKQHQLLVALHGRAKVKTRTPDGKELFHLLSNERMALHVPPMNWVELYDFDFRAVILVAASGDYDESEYLRDNDAFAPHPVR